MNKRLAIFSFICRSVHDNAHRNERKQTQISFKKQIMMPHCARGEPVVTPGQKSLDFMFMSCIFIKQAGMRLESSATNVLKQQRSLVLECACHSKSTITNILGGG